MGKEPVVDDPGRKCVPFVDAAAVDADSPFDLRTQSVKNLTNLLVTPVPFDTCWIPSPK